MSKTKTKIIEYKVDSSKINVDKVASVSKLVNNRITEIEKKNEEFQNRLTESIQKTVDEINQKLNEIYSKCDENANCINDIVEVIEDHKKQIEAIGN